MSRKKSPVRILLIEDDPNCVLIVNEHLKKCREKISGFFEIEKAENLAQGLERLTQRRYDIVLLDLTLPDSKGIDTLNQLRPHTKGIPVVILTGIADEAVALEALDRGAADYLIKNEMSHNSLGRTVLFAIERFHARKELESLTGELKAKNELLERFAVLDHLTEVLNRRGLEQTLHRESRWSRRAKSELIAALISLDNFKQINGSLGHVAGDVVLKEIASRLKASLRVSDYIGRIGGDEFLVLLPETPLTDGIRVAEKLRLSISSSPVSVSKNEGVQIKASIGVLPVSITTFSLEELLTSAYKILERSKRSRKNKVFVGNPSGEAQEVQGDFISNLTQRLSNDGQFWAVMQPICRLINMEPVGYEFLTRSTSKGFEMPADFFRASLEANALTLVDQMCFKVCLSSAACLQPDLKRHINLFPSTMINVPIEELIEEIRSFHDKGIYCIEISEAQIIGDPSYLVTAVRGLKQHGILVAIDDVGFGRSCVESLTLLEPDIVKIDRKAITGAKEDLNRIRSLERLLSIGRSLGAEVIAEGIESRNDLEVLIELGVRYGQGYFIGMPAKAPSRQKSSL
ncbi:MAG: diguanylate cyclase [Candidatus Omnitrophica bacterium]|nr:diguanylate cyclase [Candidatus Omnitrophota bacterium]